MRKRTKGEILLNCWIAGDALDSPGIHSLIERTFVSNLVEDSIGLNPDIVAIFWRRILKI